MTVSCSSNNLINGNLNGAWVWHSNGGLFVVAGEEQMSVCIPLNPQPKQQFLSCKPDGVAGLCREVLRSSATPFLSASIEPHWPHQVIEFLRRLQTQIHTDAGTPQQLAPDRNKAAQNITAASPWFSNKGAIYACFTPPHYCNNIKSL